MRKAMAVGAVTLLLAPAAPSAAASADGCTLGSPNIVRDVTDCAQSVLDNCSPGGSPNIITDLQECLR